MSFKCAALMLAVGVLGCAPSVDQTPVTPDSEKPPLSSDKSPADQVEPKVKNDPEPEAEKPSSLFKWAPNREEGLKEAVKGGGYVVLAFWVDYSAPCRVMKHEAFNDVAVARKLEKAVIVPVEPQKEKGMMKEYGIQSIPMLVFIKSDGKKFGQIAGYMTLEGFKHELDRVQKG